VLLLNRPVLIKSIHAAGNPSLFRIVLVAVLVGVSDGKHPKLPKSTVEDHGSQVPRNALSTRRCGRAECAKAAAANRFRARREENRDFLHRYITLAAGS
jgi:hypothetical protein